MYLCGRGLRWLARDRGAVDRDDDVALSDPGGLGRRSLKDIGDPQAAADFAHREAHTRELAGGRGTKARELLRIEVVAEPIVELAPELANHRPNAHVLELGKVRLPPVVVLDQLQSLARERGVAGPEVVPPRPHRDQGHPGGNADEQAGQEDAGATHTRRNRRSVIPLPIAETAIAQTTSTTASGTNAMSPCWASTSAN